MTGLVWGGGHWVHVTGFVWGEGHWVHVACILFGSGGGGGGGGGHWVCDWFVLVWVGFGLMCGTLGPCDWVCLQWGQRE